MSYNINEYSGQSINDLKDADRAIKEISEIERFIKGVESERDARIDQVKKQAEERIGDRRERLEVIEKRLEGFCMENRGDIFKEKNSVKLIYGDLFLKKSPPKLKLVEDNTWDDVIDKIEQNGSLAHCIRIKKEIDKNQVKKQGKETHDLLGVFVDRELKFSYKVK